MAQKHSMDVHKFINKTKINITPSYFENCTQNIKTISICILLFVQKNHPKCPFVFCKFDKFLKQIIKIEIK